MQDERMARTIMDIVNLALAVTYNLEARIAISALVWFKPLLFIPEGCNGE
jgi:hypothetical protein